MDKSKLISIGQFVSLLTNPNVAGSEYQGKSQLTNNLWTVIQARQQTIKQTPPPLINKYKDPWHTNYQT